MLFHYCYVRMVGTYITKQLNKLKRMKRTHLKTKQAVIVVPVLHNNLNLILGSNGTYKPEVIQHANP